MLYRDIKQYRYFMIYIKNQYIDLVPLAYSVRSNINDVNQCALFAYTDNKKLLKKFFEIHDKSKFVVKEIKISKEEVNQLAISFQNDIICKRKVSYGYDPETDEELLLEMAITNREYMSGEMRSFNELDSIWKFVWSTNTSMKREFQNALNILEYRRMYNLLQHGKCVIFPKMITPNIYHGIYAVYGEIMN